MQLLVVLYENLLLIMHKVYNETIYFVVIECIWYTVPRNEWDMFSRDVLGMILSDLDLYFMHK